MNFNVESPLYQYLCHEFSKIEKDHLLQIQELKNEIIRRKIREIVKIHLEESLTVVTYQLKNAEEKIILFLSEFPSKYLDKKWLKTLNDAQCEYEFSYVQMIETIEETKIAVYAEIEPSSRIEEVSSSVREIINQKFASLKQSILFNFESNGKVCRWKK